MATGTTNVGFEEKLWSAADKLRSNMDAAEYKHVVLGLIFLKYVSDSFEEKYRQLLSEGYGDEEDRDEYLAENVFWVPKEARWSVIKSHATSPDIGKIIDDAMEAIERENDSLKGVLTKNYSRPELDKTRLGELVTLFTNIEVGSTAAQEKDVLGRVYEYFLSKFASAEGKLGGEFYTPSCIVRTLVEMIEPFEGQIFDPACGSGGMFCQSARFVKEHQGNVRDISIFGQESNPTTWKLAKMNLAIRGLEANLGKHNADSFHDDQHKTLKANYILANPPFNISDWGGERLQDDVRWKYGIPPVGNANFAWLQHMIHHLNPIGGVAGTVLANGSLSSNTSNEGEIRKNMINGDVVECIVSLPGQLFYSTGIPVSLWILRKGKTEYSQNKILFIDARNLGHMIDRKVRELSEEDIQQIASTYQNWRQGKEYEDVKGFCKSATLKEVSDQDYILTPGRYVGIAEQEEDSEPFEEKMKKTIGNLDGELSAIRAGRANPNVLNKIMVDYYGTPTPIQQVANVSVPEARMIQIQPWEKKMVREIEKAIMTSDLGINPTNDGTTVRLLFPELTEDRRKELVKDVKKKGDNAKVAIRNVRRDANDAIKKENKAGDISDDEAKNLEDEVQKLTDKYVAQIDKAIEEKSAEILTV